MLQRAETLEDLYKALSPQPLIAPDDFAAFYRQEINDVRGGQVVERMRLGLRRAHGTMPYKALLMGHAGVGKSTELTRLTREVEDKYRVIRLSASESLDPISFQPFDVVLLMMIEVARRTAEDPPAGAGRRPDDAYLKDIENWFATEKDMVSSRTETTAQAAAGAGVTGETVWARFTGLFASVKGEIKYASVRDRQKVNYRLSRLDELIGAANRLLLHCNHLLRAATGHEWLFLFEDFDKAGISPKQTEDLFVTYANAIRELDAHLVFTIPITLGYSPRAGSLPVPQEARFVLPDTMVFDREHRPYAPGREAIGAVLEARMRTELFAPGERERLIEASGGNLRNLFAMTASAGDTALLRGGQRIEADDVSGAIRQLRTDYERQLGESQYDQETGSDGKARPIAYEAKAERMLRIYQGDPEAKIPAPVLYSLLRSRAVQEFNGERWFGVHPLVVDLLVRQNRIARPDSGRVPGGTE